MNNDSFIVMYCNECIATFKDLEEATDFMGRCKAESFYKQKNEFSIHIKVVL